MRLLVYIVVAYIVYIMAKKFIGSSQETARRGRGNAVDGEDEGSLGKAEETVLDPVCDSYIAKNRAVKTMHNKKVYYFCGTECRDRFIADKDGGETD